MQYLNYPILKLKLFTDYRTDTGDLFLFYVYWKLFRQLVDIQWTMQKNIIKS